MKSVYILHRVTGTYEYSDVILAVFITQQGAELAKKRLDLWFTEHPRPEFDEMWNENKGCIDPIRLRPFICPLDPGHIDDYVLDVPCYYWEQADIMMVREFLNPEYLAIKRADRQMFGKPRGRPTK